MVQPAVIAYAGEGPSASSSRCTWAGMPSAAPAGAVPPCPASRSTYSCSTGDIRSVRASASTTWRDGGMSRPCSSHVYQVWFTPESNATSSRRSPGVRRGPPAGTPATRGSTWRRRERRNSASSRRAVADTGAPPRSVVVSVPVSVLSRRIGRIGLESPDVTIGEDLIPGRESHSATHSPLKPRSYEVTDGIAKAPARAMLRAVGMGDDDWEKPQIGVASSWNEITPCNLSLDRLAKRAKEGVRAAGGFPLEFVTIAVSDGISMGHEGMRASLVSREVIADSVETMMHAERFDALVTFAGCDKSLPGMLMAAARLNVPSVFLYGGSILPGRLRDRALDIVSVFEAVGAYAAGQLDAEELEAIERNA